MIAIYQCCAVISSYVEHEQNALQVVEEKSVSELSENLLLTVCHRSWMDHGRVANTGVSYKHVLFALSLIESLDVSVLDEIEDRGIPDEDKIWGMKSNCTAARKKRSLLGLTSPVTNLVDNTLDPALGVLTNEQNEPLTEEEINEKVFGIKEGVCTRCERSMTEMEEWESHSKAFAREVGSNHTTLTSFLASIARVPDTISRLGARVGWTVALGQLCEVVQIPLQRVSEGLGVKEDQVGVFIEMPLGNGSLKQLLSSPQEALIGGSFRLLPFYTHSSYDPSAERVMGTNVLQKSLDQLLQLNTLIGVVTGGAQLYGQLHIPKVTKTQRKKGCQTAHILQRHSKNSAGWKCAKECNKAAESRLNGYRITSKNDVGDIPLDQGNLAPGRVVGYSVDKVASEACMQKQGCTSAHFCEEWEYRDIEVESRALAVPRDECQDLDRLAVVNLDVRMDRGYLLSNRGFLQFTEVVGMVGGILGLYLGASLITILHAIIFCCSAMAQGLCRRKYDVDIVK